MKRPLAIAAGALLAVVMYAGVSTGASAQAVTVQPISLPPGSSAIPVQPTVNGVACGAPVTLSATAPTTVNLPSSCAPANATVGFTVGGTPVTQTATLTPGSITPVSLTGLVSASPEVVLLPAGTGTVNFSVNGAACGSATLGAAPVSATLPVTCAPVNGTLSISLGSGQQVAGTFNLGTPGGTTTVQNLSPILPVITLPAGPAGTMVMIMCGTTVGGMAMISPTGPTSVTLSQACSIPSTTLSLQGHCNIPLASTISLPANLSTTPIPVSNLNPSVPLTLSVPAGTGTLTVLSGGNVVATTNLSASTQTISLPAICPGSTLSFNVVSTPGAAATPVGQTLVVPATGSGALTLSSLVAQVTTQVPAPAKTGNGGLVESGGSPWVVLALATVAVALVGGTRVVAGMRRR